MFDGLIDLNLFSYCWISYLDINLTGNVANSDHRSLIVLFNCLQICLYVECEILRWQMFRRSELKNKINAVF